MQQIGTFHGIGDIGIYGFFQMGFFSDNGETIRPLGTNFLKNGQVTSDFKYLDDLFNQPTGSSGLDFPSIDSPCPLGYRVSYFVDTEYRVTGWNWRRLSSTGGFNTLEDAQSFLNRYNLEHPINVPSVGTTPTPIVVTPVVTPVTTTVVPAPVGGYAGEYAVIGQVYQANEKPILHCASYRDDHEAQYYTVKKDGLTIFELSAGTGYEPSKVYWGNHPKEVRIPVEDGNYEFHFINTGQTSCIVGVTHNDPYLQYMRGGLSSTAYNKYLQSNEEVTFNLDIIDFEKRSYKKNYFDLDCPIYENGRLCVDKIEIQGCPNGIQLQLDGVTGLRLYKWNDPSKFLDIQITTRGYYEPATYKVTAKNGLEIDTRHITISAYNITTHKIFNNGAVGYGDNYLFQV